jgi:hypothetical protein
MRPVVDYGMNLPDNLWGLADALSHIYAVIAQHPDATRRVEMLDQCKDMERLCAISLIPMLEKFGEETDKALAIGGDDDASSAG